MADRSSTLSRWFTRRPWATPQTADMAAAGVLCLLDLAIFSSITSAQWRADATVSIGVVILYGVLGFVPLVWRRQAPMTVLGFMVLHSIAASSSVLGYRPVLGVLAGLYAVASGTTGWRAFTALPLGYAASAVWVVDEVTEANREGRPAPWLVSLFGFGLLVTAVWLTGRGVHVYRQRYAALELKRQHAAREAAASERARIARDLHDIVSHAVSVMVLQAAGAQLVLTKDPERARQALRHIETSGKQAMSELRRLLDVLHPATDDEPEQALRQGIEDLDELIAEFRRAGLQVELHRHGRAQALDPSVDLSAYRIVREALTNVAKHAGTHARVVVSVDWGDALQLRIFNEDSGAARPRSPHLSTGYGLVGLRERATTVGGQLGAGQTPDGGFEVVATLPVASLPQPSVSAHVESDAP